MIHKYSIRMALLIALVATLSACGGAEKSLDAAGLNLGRDVTSLLGNVTKQLGSINDLESARASLPQLKEFDGKLDGMVKQAKELSPESKNALSGMVKNAMPALETATQKLSNMEGMGEVVMPTLNSIMAKVRDMT